MKRLLPALALCLLAGCGGPRDGATPPPTAALLVLRPGAEAPPGAAAVARVEVVSTPRDRERGLMGRDALPPDTGMLFVYPGDRRLRFWMKDCRGPLSAAFMDREGRILNVAEMAPGAGIPDEELPYYASEGEARFVLEMEGGWFARKGIGPGHRADLSAALRGVEVR